MASFLTENGTFFNRDNWSEWLEEEFLHELQYEAVRAGRCLRFDDVGVFSKVLENLKLYTNLDFQLGDIHLRFKLAHLRYNTWKGIMEHEDVVYDPNTYSVIATTWTWIELCESYELASAYHKVSMERMWPELNAIFGPDDARSPSVKAMLPKKPPRAFSNIDLDGNRIPTIDEIIADYVDEEKHMWERSQKRKKKKPDVAQQFVPADMMSTTKGEGRVLVPSREVLIISTEGSNNCAPVESSGENVRAKRFLSF